MTWYSRSQAVFGRVWQKKRSRPCLRFEAGWGARGMKEGTGSKSIQRHEGSDKLNSIAIPNGHIFFGGHTQASAHLARPQLQGGNTAFSSVRCHGEQLLLQLLNKCALPLACAKFAFSSERLRRAELLRTCYVRLTAFCLLCGARELF